jgi:major membrane immunogen (membrane-anchored lipoprotein)
MNMKELKQKYFQYSDKLIEWVNENSVEVVSITSVSRFTSEGEGYLLFYF